MKILIIRFSSIGDIILTTPVVRCLKKQLGAEVHFLTKQSFRSVLEANPYIDQLHTIQKHVKEVLPTLQEQGFDLIVDLHKNLRSFQVKSRLGVPSKSFNKINWEKWLMVKFKINRLPEQHIVDRNLATVSHLGVKNDGEGLDYFLEPSDEIDLAHFFEQHQSQMININDYIAFVIGAAHDTKRLPTDKIVDICNKLNTTIVLLGGPNEKDQGAEIVHRTGAFVINACGQLKLNQSAYLVQQARKVITHDTGLMHMAAAFDKDIVSIWGNTIPDFGMYPYFSEAKGHNVSVQVEGLKCRPCSKIGYKKCPKGHFQCMWEIDEYLVVSEAKKQR